MIKRILRPLYNRLFPLDAVMSTVHHMKNPKPRLKIMNPVESIDYIRKTGCSVARFGEGEFELILGGFSEKGSSNGVLGFQNRSDDLVGELKAVLASDDPNLLVCIPYALNDILGRTLDSRNFWYYWCERDDQRRRITDLIRSFHGTEKVFGDTQISRPYIAWKTSRNADIMFPRLKGLWKDKDIIIVEGAKTRLGVGNDLFIGTRSIKRILGPATNAFDHRNLILDKIKQIHTNELVIMALGPTATILAAKLSEAGIQAIDIGHVDIEYEWYLRKSSGHDLIPGKYTNEVAQGSQVDDCEDTWYTSQIVARIEP